MRDDLRDLARLDTVVERKVEIVGHLDRLVARDQGSKRDEAAVPRREIGTFPYVPEQRALRVLREGRGDRADIVKREHRIRPWYRLCRIRLRRCRSDQGKSCECRSKTFHFDLLPVRSVDP